MTTQSRTARVLPITGYLDRLSARPGEALEVKVSSPHEGRYEASVVRVLSGDPNPDGPGVAFEAVPGLDLGRHAARLQPIHLGSYARVAGNAWFAGPVLTLSLLVQPWLLRASPATAMAYRDRDGNGWSLDLTEHEIRFTVRDVGGDEQTIAQPCALKKRHWYHLWAGFDRLRSRLRLGCLPLDSARDGTWVAANESAANLPALTDGGDLTMAACLSKEGPQSFFNGRLEDPTLWATWADDNEGPPETRIRRRDRLVAQWDFAIGIEGQSVTDVGPRALNGWLVNVPTRGVKGARWSGAEMSWRARPREYAAIHFHEDDLYDCGWATDFTFEVPPDMASGLYAVRLRMGEHWDVLPFYVLPPKGQRTANVCYLASTFTYQAYGNHARGNCDDEMRERIAAWGAYPHNPDDYPIYGGATYNFHPDGSGHAYSTRLRPLLTMRPGFITFVDARGSGLRHYPADTHLVAWFEQSGIAFDVVTDEDLDNEGLDLLKDYPVVVTGSHPEYHTQRMMDALEAHTLTGGNLIYLGGNGFYWKIVTSERLPGTIEVRRGEGGIRAWAAEPGEYYHALDGSYGGLWRRNDRPPQKLTGIGFSGQGLFEGSYYRRLPASRAPEVAWIFDGVKGETLGNFGFSGGGAAGFELDRADFELGTPQGTWILARSEKHASHFVVVPEELLSHLRTVSGEDAQDLVRAEIVYFTTPAGGQVFSVGSITFCGSLPVNGGDNDISRVLGNVVRRFATR